MVRPLNAIRVLARILASALRSPRTTAQALKASPDLAQGAQFSRETAFSTQRQTGDDTFDAANPLRSYFDAYTKGAGIWKFQHYFDIYQRHFSKFVGREVCILEVGIYSGGSLRMWKEYFGSGCRVIGVDIEPACMAYEDDRTRIFIGDQADRSFWAQVKQAAPVIDILIDDGGHEPEQQRVTLEEMLPHLRPGGVYLCEDIFADSNRFASYLHGLAGSLHSWAPSPMPNGATGLAATPSAFQRAIRAIHLYPFAAVIETRERDLDQFVAPKHGTEWQPFL